MRASLRLASHLLRVHWRAWLVVALLTGVAGAAVLAAAAGARRTETAYPRFLAWSHASDMLIAPAGSGVGGYDDALGRLPGVEAVAPVVGLNIELVPGGRATPPDIVVVAPLDRRYERVVHRSRVIAGRLPDPRHPFQAAIDQVGAADLGRPSGRGGAGTGPQVPGHSRPDLSRGRECPGRDRPARHQARLGSVVAVRTRADGHRGTGRRPGGQPGAGRGGRGLPGVVRPGHDQRAADSGGPGRRRGGGCRGSGARGSARRGGVTADADRRGQAGRARSRPERGRGGARRRRSCHHRAADGHGVVAGPSAGGSQGRVQRGRGAAVWAGRLAGRPRHAGHGCHRRAAGA